jgi:hypothetical protein
MLVVIPEEDIRLPDPSKTAYPELKAFANAACQTINLLEKHGTPVLEPTGNDNLLASDLLNEYAKNSKKKMSVKDLVEIRPEAVIRTAEIIRKFDHVVVKEARQLRSLVVNKLILETENPSASIRIRALELIGKMTEVGVFTERKEITVTNRNAEEVKDKLKEKLNQMRTLVKNEEGVYEDIEEDA